MTTIFDKIVSGEIPSYIVWQDDNYMAFLTPFANTPGVTVVIPKTNPGDDVFALDDAQYQGLMLAVKQVAGLLREKLSVARVAMVFEGTGVAHVHAKLYPLHGDLASRTDIWSHETDFTEEYRGYITTHEGPEMSAAQLQKLQAQIRS